MDINDTEAMVTWLNIVVLSEGRAMSVSSKVRSVYVESPVLIENISIEGLRM